MNNVILLIDFIMIMIGLLSYFILGLRFDTLMIISSLSLTILNKYIVKIYMNGMEKKIH